jgi:hypothetical protein
MKSVSLVGGAGLLLLVSVAPRPSLAQEPGTHRLPRTKVWSFGLTLVPDQMSLLKRIDYRCLPDVFTNWAERHSGLYTAVILTHKGRPVCIDGAGPDLKPNTRAWGKVIALRRRGMNLIRLDHNFGGSGTFTSFGLVSVVERRISAPGAPQSRQEILLLHYELPVPIDDDRSAAALANRIASGIN